MSAGENYIKQGQFRHLAYMYFEYVAAAAKVQVFTVKHWNSNFSHLYWLPIAEFAWAAVNLISIISTSNV